MFHKTRNSISLQTSIAVGLSVFIVFLLVIVGIDTRNVATKVIDTRVEINTRTKQSGEIARLTEEAKQAAPKKVILGDAIPKKDELFTFPNQVAQIGSEQDVIAKFTFGSESGEQINYSLITRGSYENITEFVRTLKNDIPFMNISSFDLVLGAGEYNMNFTGKVFFNGKEE